MKSIASIAVLAVAVVCAMAMAPQNRGTTSATPHADHAATYEHLATAIIAIRETEDSLIRGMLMTYHDAAAAHLDAATALPAADRQRHLESAAVEITNLANEGDKRIQAVRQRLLKAGHHHHTDAETQEDFIFIDSREKAELLTIAQGVARMSQASADDLRTAARTLTAHVEQAMKTE